MHKFKSILKTKLIAAPLAGISCAPFRVLPFLMPKSYSRPDYSCTEMLSAKHIASGAQQNPRFIKKDPREGTLCVQIAAETEREAAIAAEFAIEQIGADILDLNCGCPKPKIRKKGLGSKLLSDSKQIARIINAMQLDATPVTVKIRIDSTFDSYNSDVAKSIEDAGASAIIVHGRHWTEDYNNPINYEQIASIKNSVTIPVIANGNVSCETSAKKMLELTNCDALMIGRATIGNPWVFEEISSALNGKSFTRPTKNEIKRVLLSHVCGVVDLIGERPAIFQARRLCKHYFPLEEDFILSSKVLRTMLELKECLDSKISDS
jgi:tRNA-dihydrouridine synthase B